MPKAQGGQSHLYLVLFAQTGGELRFFIMMYVTQRVDPLVRK